jgi:DNA-binding SARP family transcriptional activator
MDALPLRIALLGPPVLYWSGETLPISRRQVRAVLYRLAADLRPIPREQLCALLWPEEPLSTARRSLTHLLTHLRLALPEADLLEYSSESIALNPDRTWCDTKELEQIYAIRHRLFQAKPGADQEWRQSLEAVENVIQSYRGPFLSGFSLRDSPEFEAWVGHERQYYECRFLEILIDLIDYHQQWKDYPNAIAHAARYLDIDNLAEEVHCKLIELYGVVGDRSAAERQFERCAAALEQDLGISPSPKTWAIYQSAIGPRLPGMPVSPQGLAVLSSLKQADTPFVGRTELLKAIDQAFSLAGSGRGKVILVSGEPGSGKSRLLGQVAAHYHCAGTVLYSICSPGLRDLPYHPIAEAFRPVVESQSQNIKVSPLWLAEVARLLPEIYPRFPDLPPPLPARPEEARRRLFEALSQLASSLQTRFHPLLLCLDDLQWADAATLEWLIYLANRLAFQGLEHMLILGTFRSDEGANLAELRSALNRLGLLEEHPLPDFEIDEVAEILRHHLGSHEDHSDLVIQLHQITGGNPFFLLETLRALIDNHMIPGKLADLNNLPLPKTVQETIHQRMVHLDHPERLLLEFLSVLKHPCTLEMVLEGMASGEMETLDRLESLVFHGLLRENQGIYRLAHDLTRLVVYQAISYNRRRLLHRGCAKLLEKYRPGEIALLAWHFEQSGESGKAAAYALRAGEDSARRLAHGEALDFFSRALVSLKQEASSLTAPDEIAANYRQQSMALTRRGRVFRSLGEMQSYQDDIEEEARLATALGDRAALAVVHLREANVHRWFCRYQPARECAEKALGLSRQIGNVLLEARALRERGLTERAIGDFPKARTSLENALRLFQEQVGVSYEIHTLCNLSALATYTADFSRAEKLAHQALTRCEQARLTDLRCIPLGDLGAALAASGRGEQGKECLLTSLDLAREIPDRTQEIFCLCHLGWLENRAGKPDAALGFLRNGLALAERLDSRSEQSRLYAGLAEAHRLLGNTRLARGFAVKALDLARQHGRRHDLSWAEQILAKIE